MAALLTPSGRVSTVVSTAPRHRALGAGRGSKLGKRAKARTKRFGAGMRSRRLAGGRRLVLGIRKGKVRWVAVTTQRSRSAARAQLRRAGVR
jgi:hypothetical protein